MKDGLGNDFVRAFCEDADGGVWIGTDGGVSHWRDGVFQTFKRSTGLVYSSIRMLLIDRTGTLWVATDGGVSWIRSGKLVADPTLDRLRGLRVWALHEDAAGGMWIGTQGAGLFLLKDGALTQFTIAHGLPSNKIHFIGEDRAGYLWLSGPSGVVSVSRADLETMRGNPARHLAVRIYGTPEGLNTNQMTGGVQSAGAITSAGDVWLPSTTGAVRVVPERPERRDNLSLVIGQLIADGQPVAASRGNQCAAGRWQAGDPLHRDSTRHARTPALQIPDGRVRARLDARRPAAGGLLHQPSAWHLSVPCRRVRDERAAERDGQSDGDQAASALLPHQVVPRAVRVDGSHRCVGRVPAARAEHPPAVRRGARRTQSAGA